MSQPQLGYLATTLLAQPKLSACNALECGIDEAEFAMLSIRQSTANRCFLGLYSAVREIAHAVIAVGNRWLPSQHFAKLPAPF